MRGLGRIFVALLAVVGGFTLLTIGFALWVALTTRTPPLPGNMVLLLDLDAGVVETAPDTPLARLGLGKGYALADVVEALDRAARDPRVHSLVARLDSPHIGMAQAQELREAVEAFRNSGKRAALFSADLGESSTIPYYLASAFQELWLQPSGMVGLTGFVAQQPFIKGTLDSLDVKAQFGARYEYKTAIDLFTQSKFTKEGKESLQLLVDSWTRQAVRGIADARKLKPEQVKGLIDRAPLLADEARKAGLVDRLGYWDELEKDVTKGGGKVVNLSDYIDQLRPDPHAVKVALIYGVGPVEEGQADDEGPLADRGVMSARRITKAFHDAVKDPEVKAILFRIDSPGGSYTASDAIWRAVATAREAGKPVVVSMGNVAASGGYFSAMGADKIIAQPGTITGSIGVFSGKFVLADFWKKLGISWDEVHTGQNALMWSVNEPFTPAAWDRLNAVLDHIYGDFTGKAEKARGITAADMDKVARGRIWPGMEAKQVGLVDDMGGYATALVRLRELARQPSQMPMRLVTFPRPKQPLEYLLEATRSGRLPADFAQGLAVDGGMGRWATLLAPLAGLVSGSHDALVMPPVDAH